MQINRRKSDEAYMRMAMQLAQDAADRGEVPVGAVVVAENGEVLARAYNQVEMLKDGTAHAEMIAITQAASTLGDWRLTTATLYVTKEPCAMCAGAMVNCRLGRLVFGCSDPRAGAAGSALDLTDFQGMLHQVEVSGGLCADECLEQLQTFFRERRNQKTKQKKQDEWPDNLSMN